MCMRRYFFSILALCASLVCGAQESIYEAMPRRQVFVRFGCDLSRFALPYVGDIGSKGLEFSLDGEINYNWFPVIEVGRQSLRHTTDTVIYKMSGEYARIGFDYNILKYKHRLDRDIFFVGARIAHTSFSHEAPSVVMNHDIWGTLSSSLPSKSVKATWGEAVVGLKGEIFPNIYLGITVRAKMLFAHSKYEALTPYIIPGYGKGYNKFNAGISYSLMYAIPIRGVGDDGFTAE